MKKHRFISLCAILGLCQVGSAALVAEWDFDERRQLWKDNVGYNDLTATSDLLPPVYETRGKVGGAARFEGENGFKTPVDIYPAGSFTFAVFINPDDDEVNSVVATSRREGGFDLWAAGEPNSWRIRAWNVDKEFDYKIGDPVITGWTHLAITFEATEGPDASGNYIGTLSLYVDGLYATGMRTSYAANDRANLAMRIGSMGSHYEFRGLMDEMKLYDEALSDEQIRKLANP